MVVKLPGPRSVCTRMPGSVRIASADRQLVAQRDLLRVDDVDRLGHLLDRQRRRRRRDDHLGRDAGNGQLEIGTLVAGDGHHGGAGERSLPTPGLRARTRRPGWRRRRTARRRRLVPLPAARLRRCVRRAGARRSARRPPAGRRRGPRGCRPGSRRGLRAGRRRPAPAARRAPGPDVARMRSCTVAGPSAVRCGRSSPVRFFIDRLPLFVSLWNDPRGGQRELLQRGHAKSLPMERPLSGLKLS